MLIQTITLLVLAMINHANYTLTSLKGNVYNIEEQSKVHLYHETWKLVIGINFTSNDQRLTSIDTTIRLFETACNNECPRMYEIHLVRNRYNRLRYRNIILMKLLGKQQTRQRRALANFVGDISKTLFGTHNENDLSQINAEFDEVYSDNKNIATVFSNHTKIQRLLCTNRQRDSK